MPQIAAGVRGLRGPDRQRGARRAAAAPPVQAGFGARASHPGQRCPCVRPALTGLVFRQTAHGARECRVESGGGGPLGPQPRPLLAGVHGPPVPAGAAGVAVHQMCQRSRSKRRIPLPPRAGPCPTVE
eukprot:scaffold175_cov150-Isochrysis_galbana.AAC.2